MTVKKYTLIQVFFFFFFFAFSFMILYMYKNNYFEEKKVTLKYRENNDIDYKVYLKKNDFFDDKYLEKGRTYITSLIDHINVDYNYSIQFDHLVNGEYKYYIYVTVESGKANGKSYWSKDYKLTDEKSMKVKNVGEYKVHENVDIDYNKYNKILMSFKKTLGLTSANGTLKIYMAINSDVEGNSVKAPIESRLLLAMPLSEMTIEAAIDLDAHNNIQSVDRIINADRARISKCFGAIYIVATVFFIALIIYINKKKSDLNKYENTLKKILNTYDSIIVNVKRIPDVRDFKRIEVASFEELLDAHSEIRMPINFYRDGDKSYFLLVNDKTVWIYKMGKLNIQKVKI